MTSQNPESPLVRAVERTPDGLRILFASGGSVVLLMAEQVLPESERKAGPRVASGTTINMTQRLQRYVEMGAVVFIVRDQAQHVIPRHRAQQVLKAIAALRAGDTSAGQEFPEDIRAQLRTPERLVRP